MAKRPMDRSSQVLLLALDHLERSDRMSDCVLLYTAGVCPAAGGGVWTLYTVMIAPSAGLAEDHRCDGAMLVLMFGRCSFRLST